MTVLNMWAADTRFGRLKSAALEYESALAPLGIDQMLEDKASYCDIARAQVDNHLQIASNYSLRCASFWGMRSLSISFPPLET